MLTGLAIESAGLVEHVFAAVAEFLGVGAPTVKSVRGGVLSVHPPFHLNASVV